MIEGNYRGKKSEKFKFNCQTLEFEYNNAAPAVAAAFELALKSFNNQLKVMNKQNIQQIIRELFRQNYNLYPESYPLTTGLVNNSIKNEKGELLVADEAAMNAQKVAKGYWAERNEDEIERDEKAGVTEVDYVEWVMKELSELIPDAE